MRSWRRARHLVVDVERTHQLEYHLLRITPCPLAHYPRALTDPYASRSGGRRATAKCPNGTLDPMEFELYAEARRIEAGLQENDGVMLSAVLGR